MGSREKMARFSSLKSAHLQVNSDNPASIRLQALLDPDSFVSFDSLVESKATTLMPSRTPVAGDGIWTGYGTIDGRLVYVAASDPTVFGGSLGSRSAAKMAKAVDLATQAGVPFIALYETGGVRIDEGLTALESVGDVLASLTAASGSIPLISAVYGPCAGSAALMAAAGDIVLMTRTGSALTVNGPGVIAAIENKTLTPAAIGGAEYLGAGSGLVTLIAQDDTDLASQIRLVLSYLPDCADGFGAVCGSDDPNRCETALDGLAADLDHGLDIRQAIALIVDDGQSLELKADHEPALYTGLARLDGRVVGLIAVSGSRISASMADKAAWLTGLCDRFAIPTITLLDTAGFELGLAAEQGGLLRAATRLFQTGRLSESLRLAVVIGQAFGPAYLSLASKSGGTDLVLAWPTAEIAAVPSDTAAHILFREEIAAAADPQSVRAAAVDRYATELASAQAAAATGLVDEVILPSATRPRLISALMMLDPAGSLY